MLIKSMSRKSQSFAQLYDYITRDTGSAGDLLTSQNLPQSATDRSGRLKAFFDNERHMKRRKGGVRAYHEVLAFHPDDAPALTKEALRKLTEYYLQLRAPHALAIAEAHYDTGQPHVHVMISANELNSNKRVRVSQRDFARIKARVEELQRQLYPELSHSLCQHDLDQPRSARLASKEERVAASEAVNAVEFQKRLERPGRTPQPSPAPLRLQTAFQTLRRFWRSATELVQRHLHRDRIR